MDIVISIAAKIAEYTVAPIGRKVGYLFFYNGHFRKLSEQVEQLEDVRDSIQHSVEFERRNAKEIEPVVQSWMNRANQIIEEAKKLREDPNRSKAGCSRWSFPNLGLRYKLSRKAKKMAMNVADLQGEGKFDKVGFLPPLYGVRLSSGIMGSENFESRVSVMNEIIRALTNPKLNNIGVFGFGGVGKTTLVKELAEKVKEEKLFDAVVMASVTQTPDYKRIQGEIADLLGLQFSEETVVGRAYRLRQRIKREETILIILDNIWARIDLEEVGIPLGDDHEGCKVLFVSRNQDVLHEMEIQKDFRLEILGDEETWSLFEVMAGDVVKDPSLHHIATEVAKKCAGLPILIVTVARALKKKDIHAWKDTLIQLSRVHNKEIQDITYSALELSYNGLEGEEVRALFLLCGVLEAFTAITDLLKYGMGLGLFKHINTIEDARNRLYKLISALKASCLLFEDDRERVNMHDIVREVAISIASRDQHVFSIKKGAELTTWPTEDILNICPQIILPHCHVHKLPERLHCPELKLLYINTHNRSMEIPNSFFEGMGNLTVLDFSGLNLPSLPTSFHSLTNLKTLCLDHCALGDISAIGSLRKIEILSLFKSSIYNFPNEIRQLAHLRMLDLSGSRVEIIQPCILSSLKNLEELYMGDAVIKWEVENSTKQNQNASLAELKDLHNLTALEIQVQEAWVLPRDLMFEKLEKYKILIGDVWEWSSKDKASKTLKLKLCTSIRLEHGIKALLKSVANLYLDEMSEISNVLFQLNEEGFPHLNHLHIQNNAEIQHIVNSMGRIQVHGSFPHLETMVLHNLKNLKNICHGQLTIDSFSKLRVIKITNCDQVENLFSLFMVRILPQLVEIEVSECSSMRNVVSVESDANACSITGDIKFHQLRSLALRCLPALDGFLSYEIMSMTSIPMPFFTSKVMFPNLETLELSSINLKEIWGGDQLFVTNCVQNLTSLIVKDCGHLKHLLSPSMVRCFSKLKRLEISKCHMMEEIISREGINNECSTQEEVSFPRLETITLSNMENLKTIWHPQFRGLKMMEVKSCEKLVVILPFHLQGTFRSLETLMVTDCGSLEEIFKVSANEICNEEHASQLRNLTLIRLPKLKKIWSRDPQGSLSFPNLQNVHLDTCQNMEYLFPLSLATSFLLLEDLDIKGCGAMREIVAKEEGLVGETAIFVYNRLKSLLLWDSPRLKRFYAGSYTLVCPSLKSINVFGCSSLNLFQTSYAGCREGNDIAKLQASLQQPLLMVEEVIPNLEELTLNNREASMILQSQISANLFCKIKLLRVAEFEAVPADFPYWFFQKVQNLERLIVQNCSFKEIFQDKRFVGDEGQFQTSKRLKLLRLFKLSELKHICKEGFQVDPILEVLQLLSVVHCSNLIYLMPSSVTFGHLIQLEVRNCNGMKYLISSNSTARSLVKLMTMKVQECNSLEEIVTERGGETEDIVFPTLHTLELVSLPRLNRFYSSQCLLNFPRLQEVVVKKCPRMKTFSEGATHTPMLRKVQVEDKDKQFEDLNEMIRKMFTDKVAYFSFKDLRLSEYPELKGLWYSQEKLEIFSNLKSVMVHKCDFLSDVLFTSNLLQALHNMEELEVSDCDSLETVFGMQAIGEVMQTNETSQLKKLRLFNLPKLRQVWKKDHQGTWCFQNLCVVFVRYCEGLKNIFPFSIAKNLMQLEELWIESSGIEEIVAKEEGVEEMISFVFPLVTRLTLFRLSNLRNFYPGRHISEWQSLKKLEIWQCYNVEMFAYEFPSSEDTCQEDGFAVLFQQPLFLFEKVIPNLELLVLNEKDVMRIWNGHYQANLFQKLKCLALDSFHQQYPSFLRSFLQRFPPLLEFSIGFSSSEAIFLWEGVGVDKSTGIPIQFRHLCLTAMTELKYIWNEGSHQDPYYQNIELLAVVECCMLNNLAPSSISFNNLTILTVSSCKRMIYLITLPTAKSLVQLRTMSILHCEMMEHVVNVTEVEETEDITFKNLESLQLYSLSEFKSFSSGKNTFIFPSLRYLEVTNCPEMKIFSPGVLIAPVLKEIQVEEDKKLWNGDLNNTIKHLFIAKALLKCNHVRFSSYHPELKEVWLSPVADNPYRNLKTLTVDNCGFLSKVIPNHVAPLLHNLEELKVERCDLVEVVFDLEGVTLYSLESSSLKRLYLNHLPKLKHVWKKDPQGTVSFQNLSLVHVNYCESLKNIFPPSIAKELMQLQELEVNTCEIEEIVAREERVEEEITEFLFPHLTMLRLRNLSNLMNFYPEKHNSEWPSIKNSEIWHCHSIEVFPSDLPSLIETKEKIADAGVLSQEHLLPVEKVAFHSFQHLEQFEYPQLEQLWYNRLGLQMFHNLKSLVVQNCDFLSKILFSSNLLPVLQRLEELEVRDCDSLEVVFDMEGIDANEMKVKTYTRLKKLTLFGLPTLKHVWKKDSLKTVGFDNLHAVYVAECASLKNLFPVSIAKELVQLEELEVDSCGIEEIVGEEGNEETIKFVFPNLTMINLSNLLKLKAFYAGIHDLECQSLKRINVFNCRKLTLFHTTSMGCQEIALDPKICFSRRQPLFTVEEVIPKLEELTLNNKDAKVVLEGQFSTDFFCKLKILWVSMFEDDHATFPNWVLQNAPSLESLIVEWSSFKEIFQDARLESEKGQNEISTQLKMLRLDKLPELQHICKEGSQVTPNLDALEFLEVVRCSSLINLVPSTVTFSHLTNLEVANCNGLISLITPSTAKSLVKLKIIKIEECNSLEEIVNGNGDETTDEIAFSSLEKLEMICLPRLGKFCSSKCFIKFPLLEELLVMQCPRMEIFSNGDTSTPCISGVQTEGNGECCWEGSLNGTIKKMFANMVAFYSLEHLKLSEHPEMKDLWYGQLQQKMFGNLKSLVVQKCDFLSDVLILPNLLQCLNNLEELEVRDCDSLETVFDAKEMLVEGTPQLKKLTLSDLPKLKYIWKGSQEISNFGNLHLVHIFNCQNLKNMFSVSLCQYLRHLEDLHIESCGLEEIVAKENGSEEHRFDFPQLTKIRLWNLPSLKSFYPGRHSLECHSLKELSVYHCEALQIFSFDHSDFLHPPNKYIQQSLFTFENVCPNLELLTLNEKDAMMVINGHYQPTLFSKVNFLSLQCFHEISSYFPNDFLQAFSNLVSFQVRCCSFQKLFSAEGISQHSIGAPSQFRELLLTDLDQLEYIWNEDFQSDALIQNLDRLQIIGCPSLVILLPSISFQSLTTLYVDGCKRLTYLIRSLTAKSLVRLKELAIKNCKMIEQVVIDEEEAKEEFIFESLEYLELISLSSFKSFCSGKHTFIFPSLVGLTITGCPKMQTFSPGVIIAPFLTAVVVENQKKRWKDDLNTTIKQLFIDKEVQQEVKGIVQTLSLSGSDDRRTWKASFSGEAKEGKESNESCETAQNSVPTPSIPFPWQALCEMKIPQRLISFIWTLHNSALPMADKCHLCGQQSETLDHLFLHCTFAKAIWFGSDLCLRTDQLQPDSIHGWLNIWFSQLLNHGHEMHDMTVLILLILDNIWQARNQRCMDGCLPNAQACLMKVKAQWKEYRNALMVEECVLQ